MKFWDDIDKVLATNMHRSYYKENVYKFLGVFVFIAQLYLNWGLSEVNAIVVSSLMQSST